MIHLKTIISEAKITEKNLETAVLTIKKLLEKKLSTKLYRYGGPAGYCAIQNGKGILFMYKDDGKLKAVRFNYVQGAIDSVTTWKEYRPGEPGSFTIEFGELNLLGIAKKLVDLLTAPLKAQEVPIYFVESYLTEAKRIPAVDFIAKFQEKFPNVDLSSVTQDQLEVILRANDLQLPSVISATRKKGIYNLAAVLNNTKTAASTDTEKDYYIKITAQDRATKKFTSVRGDVVASQLLDTVRTAVTNPNVEKLRRDPNSMFANLSALTRVVARGAKKALVIIGGAGIGKTHTVTETLHDEGLVKGEDWFMIKGKITTASLYQTLFMHRKGKLLVFDDTDSVWGDQDAANILKAALDSYPVREISWSSAKTMNVARWEKYKREEYEEKIDEMLESGEVETPKFPSSFEYTGSIIFISNLSKDKFDSAVLNRSAKIDMTLTDDEVFARIESIIDKIGDPSVPAEIKKEILQTIKDKTKEGLLSAPSIRTFVGAEEFFKSGLPNWRDLLEYM